MIWAGVRLVIQCDIGIDLQDAVFRQFIEISDEYKIEECN